MKRWFTVTVDTEEEWDWNTGFPTGPTKVTDIGALERFQNACQDFGVPVTYFTNHAVLNCDESVRIVKRLHDAGKAEIGFHIHPWNTPPVESSKPVPPRFSFLHNLPRELAIEKMESVFRAFAERSLPSPTSFRGGRYSTSEWIQRELVRRGCRADASIFPYTTWPDDGAPDFRDRDPWPIRRTFGDISAALWEIPLTFAFSRQPWRFWSRFFQLGEKEPLRSLKLNGIAERFLLRRVWLNIEHPMGEYSDLLLDSIRRTNLPCINFTLHSSSLVPGFSPYTRTPSDLDRLFSRLKRLLTKLAGWGEFAPATVTEVANHLERDFHESSRHQSAG